MWYCVCVYMSVCACVHVCVDMCARGVEEGEGMVGCLCAHGGVFWRSISIRWLLWMQKYWVPSTLRHSLLGEDINLEEFMYFTVNSEPGDNYRKMFSLCCCDSWYMCDVDRLLLIFCLFVKKKKKKKKNKKSIACLLILLWILLV